MSSSRRSSRARKTINYSKCGQESDDDFTESGSQPNKKTKRSQESTKKKSSQKRNDIVEDAPARVSVNDKVYQRNMDLALKISKKENLLPRYEKEDRKSNNLEATPTECDDQIKNIKKDEIVCGQSPRKQRQAATKALSKQQEHISEEDDIDTENKDEDYLVNNASEDISESDDEDEDFNDDESNDSEFELSSKKKDTSKKKTSKVNNLTSNASKPKPRLSATVIPLSKTGIVKQNISKTAPNSTPSPKVSSFRVSKTVTSPGQSLKSVWVPPGPASSSNNSPGGVSIRSPTSSGLRVGLSRKQVLKPLHSSIKIQ